MSELRGSLVEAQALDAMDPLAKYRDHFAFPENTIAYLDGNSLGLWSIEVAAGVDRRMDEWKRLGVKGWSDPSSDWHNMGEYVGELEAPLVGADPDEVIGMATTSDNIHRILATVFKPKGNRNKILVDRIAFPSDAISVESWLEQRDLDPAEHMVYVEPRKDTRLIEEEDIEEILEERGEELSALVLPVVVYSTGQLLDVKRITKAAHRHGVITIFDAAHSFGSVPHHFSRDGVDFAVWCGYKYGNGSPGGLAGMYLNRRHLHLKPGLRGWWGSDKEAQFDMSHQQVLAKRAGKYQIGTIQVIVAGAMIPAVETMNEAGIDSIRAKSLRLTDYLISLFDRELDGHGFTVITPRDKNRRGGHISVAHPQAVQINAALSSAGITPDFRLPDMIRFAPTALYNNHMDVHTTVSTTKAIMEEDVYRQFPSKRGVIA